MKIAVPDLISNSYFPAVAAVELGFFKGEGLDVTLEHIFPVDTACEAMRDGEIDSAGLDVTEPEPLPADHRLLTLENCLVVPHIASASYETRAAMSQLAAENIVAVLSGKKPPTAVNPEAVEAQGLR